MKFLRKILGKKRRKKAVNSELIERLTFAINALVPGGISVQELLKVLEVAGIDHSREAVFSWFSEWEQSADAGICKYAMDLFNKFRFQHQDSHIRAEKSFEQYVNGKCLLPDYAQDYEEPYEEFDIADQRTELMVLNRYFRFRPLISQLVFKHALDKYTGNPESALECSEAYRPEIDPAAISNATIKSLEDMYVDSPDLQVDPDLQIESDWYDFMSSIEK